METQAILSNVLAHRLQSERECPAPRLSTEWLNCLETHLVTLSACLRQADFITDNPGAGKSAAQLAAACVRMIEELDLDLVAPGEAY